MIINDLDGYYIVFDTKNWNTELDTLQNISRNSSFFPFHPTFYPSYFSFLKGLKVLSEPLFLAPKSIFLLLSLKKTILPFLSFLLG